MVRDQENCFISTSVFCFLDTLHGSTWVQFTEALSIPGESLSWILLRRGLE